MKVGQVDDDQRVKLKKHRDSMVAFRLRKKESAGILREEHKRLERTMRLHVAAIQQELSCGLDSSNQGLMRLLRELIFEKESLHAQNLALSEVIQGHQAFQSVLDNNNRREDPLLTLDIELGWRVHFADGAPSFFFQPLTPEEISGVPNPFDADFAPELPSSSMTGSFLGWIVYREEIQPTELWGKKISSRVRYTKRVHCSIDTAIPASIARERELRPILVTPLGWSCSQIDKVSTQVLQEIDPQCRVLVHNVPGTPNTRYVFLARTAQWELAEGRRKINFSMKIYDSKANKLRREAEAVEEVDWVSDGWAYFTLTEVDDCTIDVVYEHSAECENKEHADFLMVQWAQYVVQWEQIVSASKLLIAE